MKMNRKALIIAVLALIAVISVGSCSAGWFDFLGGEQDLNGQTVNLAAAASLKNVYDDELIPMFEEKYPGVKVVPTYASSGDLQTQIENGLEADVFMSAANKQMNALADEGIVDNTTNLQFLENKIVLIVPADSNSDIKSFEDLANVDGTIAIGDPESVPAGQYAKEILTNLGLWDKLESKFSLGTDVTAVLNQVGQGKSTDDVKVICEAPDDALDTPCIYPVAQIKDSKNADAAKAFMDFLQTQEAKDKFVEYGFTLHE